MNKRKNKARARGRKNNVASNGNGYNVGRFGQSSIPRSLNTTFRGGFPDRARVKLVYPDSIAIASTVTPGTYVYRGNAPFDPDFTGTGLQPPFYDEWSLAYNFYRVWGCKISVSLTAPSATTYGRFIVAARRVSTAPATSPVLLGMAAQEYCISGMVGPNGITGVDNKSRAGIGSSVVMNVSTPRFKAQTVQGFMGSEGLSAAVTAVPTDTWYWVISAINLDSSTSTTYRGIVTLEYDVEFFGRYEDSLDLMAVRVQNMADASRARALRRDVALATQSGRQSVSEDTKFEILNLDPDEKRS